MRALEKMGSAAAALSRLTRWCAQYPRHHAAPLVHLRRPRRLVRLQREHGREVVLARELEARRQLLFRLRLARRHDVDGRTVISHEREEKRRKLPERC